MSRKHRRVPRAIDPTGGLGKIGQCQPLQPAAVAKLMIETRAALVRLLEGTAEDRHFARLGMDINVAWVRFKDVGGSMPVLDTLEAAGEALSECRRIFEQHGRYGVTGPGRQAIADGVEAFEAILASSSPMQMQQAEEAVAAALKRQPQPA